MPRIQVAAFLGRLKTRYSIFLDKFFNATQILKVVIVLFVTALTAIGFAYFTVNTTYFSRTVYSEDQLPEELQTAVVVINHSDIIAGNNNYKVLIQKVVDLYNKGYISSINIYILSNLNTTLPERSQIADFLKTMPKEKLNVNTQETSPLSVCENLIDLNINKFLLMTYWDFVPRISFTCNFLGIYNKAFSIQEAKSKTDEARFLRTIREIGELLLGIGVTKRIL